MPHLPFASGRLFAVLAIAAGALQTLTYAPFDYWPLGVISCAVIFYLAERIAPACAALTGWLIGLGIFGSGASWVYVSIHDFGYTAAPLAALFTLAFCGFLALFTALQMWLYHQLRPATSNSLNNLLLFSALWIVMDWVRSWLLTGFPWLYLGYAHTQSPLSWLAPVGGVHFISLIVMLSGGLLLFLVKREIRQKRMIGLLLTLSILWGAGIIYSPRFVESDPSQPIKVTLVQGNIDQLTKWAPEYRMHSIEVYERLSAPFWTTSNVIIWPETAIPFFQDTAEFLLEDFDQRGKASQTTLMTGIPYRATDPSRQPPIRMHNSITSLGNGHGLYHKQKLVPFGEYVPLEWLLRGIIRFLDLPMSAFRPGQADQPLLVAGEYEVAPYICYEIAYPDFVAATSGSSQFLVTISNDAWFGHSIGPLQHLQIAQMRSLETARYTLRATNNGVSAIISPTGKIVKMSAQFEEATVTGTIFPSYDSTLFMRTGSVPVLIFCLISLTTFNRYAQRFRNQQNT